MLFRIVWISERLNTYRNRRRANKPLETVGWWGMIEISEYTYDKLIKERDDLIKENRQFNDDRSNLLLEIKKLHIQEDEVTLLSIDQFNRFCELDKKYKHLINQNDRLHAKEVKHRINSCYVGTSRLRDGTKIKCIAQAEKYLMARISGCLPFVISIKEWKTLPMVGNGWVVGNEGK